MSNKKRVIFYACRIISVAFLLTVYFFGLRPVRQTITQRFVLPIISPHFNNTNSPYSIENKGTALTLSFEWNDNLKKIRYQPQLGFFFLLTVIALIFITSEFRPYLFLIVFHLIALFIIILILYLSRYGCYSGFLLVSFLSSYLIPGLSFSYAALVYHFKKDVTKLHRLPMVFIR